MTTVVTFEVGATEKHQVVYSWDQMWGGRSITVDGSKIQKSRSILSFSLKQVNEFSVGEVEKHDVRIEKTRSLFFAGFRPQVIEAFVDGQKVAGDTSELTPGNIRSVWVVGIVTVVVVVAGAIGVAISLGNIIGS